MLRTDRHRPRAVAHRICRLGGRVCGMASTIASDIRLRSNVSPAPDPALLAFSGVGIARKRSANNFGSQLFLACQAVFRR